MHVSLAYFFSIFLIIYLFVLNFQPIMAILGKKKAAPRIRGRFTIIKLEINYLQPLLDVFTPSSLVGPPKV